MFYFRHILLLILSTLLSPVLNAAEISNISRNSILLSESKKTDVIRLDVRVKNERGYFITIQAESGNSFILGNNEFLLKPTLPNIDGSVRVVFDFPYLERSDSGLVRADTINRVVNHKRTRVSDQFSLCPNSGRICKPLTVMVIDDSEAIPGVRYSTALNITVESEDGFTLPSIRRINLNYQRSGSAIGLKSSTNNILLTSDNNYSNHVDFCVFSMAYSIFDLAVESQNSIADQFYLIDQQSNILPYLVSVSLNDRPKRTVIQNQWVRNGRLKRAKNKVNCTGYNARVYLAIPKEKLHRSSAGIYRDTITVKVQGR